MVAKATSNGRSATPTTAIPNSGELAGELWVCVSALSILEQESFCSPFSFSFYLFENHTIAFPISPTLPSPLVVVVVPPSHPFRAFHPLSYTFRRSFFDSILSAKRTRLRLRLSLSSATSSPLALSLSRLVLVSRSLSTYFYLSAIRRADPRPRTQSPPVPGFYYEIRDSPPASSRFTHTYFTPYTFAGRRRRAAPSRYTLANFANVGSRRITHLQQYRFFLHPRSAPRDEIRAPYYLVQFYHDEDLT